MTREERPYCYGKLECVFPMGENGLRETPESCMVCYCKTECLRTAMQGQAGDQVRILQRPDSMIYPFDAETIQGSPDVLCGPFLAGVCNAVQALGSGPVEHFDEELRRESNLG